MAGDPTRSSVWVKAFSEQVRELQKEEPWTLEVVRDLGAEEGWETYKQASAFARFDCSKCGRKWPSNQVFILFCMRLGTRGLVQMRIFNQQCKKCLIFNDPHFSSENISIALGNLLRAIRRQCYGENVFWKPRALRAEESTAGRHRSKLCEACDAGLCPLRGRWSVVTTSLQQMRESAPLPWLCLLPLLPLLVVLFGVILYHKMTEKLETNWEKFAKMINNILNKFR